MKATELLWLRATRTVWQEGVHEHYFHLFEIMKQLDCMLLFSGCVTETSQPEFAANFYGLCGSFKSGLQVLASSPHAESSGLLLRAAEHLSEHPCFTSDFDQGRHLAPLIHTVLRHAVLYDLGDYEEGVPATEVPRVPLLLSPGGVCRRGDLLWWHTGPTLKQGLV